MMGKIINMKEWVESRELTDAQINRMIIDRLEDERGLGRKRKIDMNEYIDNVCKNTKSF